MLRIIHVITRLIVGGAQENTLLTCHGLRGRGHRVILITGPSLGPEGSLIPRFLETGCELVEIPTLVRNPHPLAEWQAHQALTAHIAAIKPDVVHTHSSKAGILGRMVAWKKHVSAVVHTIHGLPFHPYQNVAVNQAWIALEKFAAKRCHAIVCVAQAMKTQALAAGVGRPEQYSVIHSGMDIQRYMNPATTGRAVRERLGIPAEAIVLGTVARLQPLKGHEDLLKITEELLHRFPRVHFLWVGDGVYKSRFLQTIEQRGWRQHFTLTGLVKPEEVADLLPAMDILVHPSYREGLPRAVAQGMLARLATVVYDCDGAGEICRTGQTGILVQPGNTAALLAALLELADNSAERTQYGLRGNKLAMELFDSRKMVDQLENLYGKVREQRDP